MSKTEGKAEISKIVIRIMACDIVKSNSEYPKDLREKCAEESAELYDKLLALCDGDTAHVATLLGQKEWFDTTRKKKTP